MTVPLYSIYYSISAYCPNYFVDLKWLAIKPKNTQNILDVLTLKTLNIWTMVEATKLHRVSCSKSYCEMFFNLLQNPVDMRVQIIKDSSFDRILRFLVSCSLECIPDLSFN